MAHANAPLTPEGRRRLIERIILDGRPISHVAAEAGVSRQRLSIWLHRFELLGEALLCFAIPSTDVTASASDAFVSCFIGELIKP